MKISEEKIDSIKKNVFYRSRDSIRDYATFDWHITKKEIDADRVNSSQALAIDFWGCIKTSGFRNEIINMLFKKNEPDWDVIFEYEDKTLLNEEKKSTQIDVLLRGSGTAIFVESKFTERDGGSCSQTKKTEKGLIQCFGKYETYRNPFNGIESKCSLSGKGIKYWKYIDMLTKYNENETYDPCPIKQGEYQWVRNICFAYAYSEKHGNIRTETVLAYVDSTKCPIADKVKADSYLGKMKGEIIDKSAFRPISYNYLLDEIIKYLSTRDESETQVFIALQNWLNKKVETI